ncbi:Asp-tRNA(Asn)/Glu-tRNA(Gln) amidotransferase subunit GatC, partial [Methanosalsum natronophilum]
EEDVERISWLARIEIDSSKSKEYAEQLNSILDYFQQLEELDTSDIEPTYHVDDLVNVLRSDDIKPSFTQEEALENCENKKDGYFKVPGIM